MITATQFSNCCKKFNLNDVFLYITTTVNDKTPVIRDKIRK